jgi:hypothetical protein
VVATFYEHCECVCRGGLATTLYHCNLEDESLDIPSRNSIVIAENRTERTKASGWWCIGGLHQPLPDYLTF